MILKTRMTIIASAVVAGLAVLFFAQMIGDPKDAPATLFDYTYVCPDGGFRVVFASDFESAVLHLDSTPIELTRSHSASGLRYDGAPYVFWSKGDEAFLERDGAIVMADCRKTD